MSSADSGVVRESSTASARWAGPAAVLGLGGAAFVFACLSGIQLAAGAFNGSRIADPVAGMYGGLVVVWTLVGAVWLFVPRVFGWSWRWSLLAVTSWLVGYCVLWAIGQASGGIQWWFFLLFWTFFGMAGGLFVASRPAPAPRGQPAQTKRRSASAANRGARPIAAAGRAARQTRMVVPPTRLAGDAGFGRVPSATVALIRQQARLAVSVAESLPNGAPAELRTFTLRAILDRTLEDWYKNGNFEGLESKDVDDLGSFVDLASSLAGGRFDASGRAIYRAALAALLDDWLVNWNSDGWDGPKPKE